MNLRHWLILSRRQSLACYPVQFSHFIVAKKIALYCIAVDSCREVDHCKYNTIMWVCHNSHIYIYILSPYIVIVGIKFSLSTESAYTCESRLLIRYYIHQFWVCPNGDHKCEKFLECRKNMWITGLWVIIRKTQSIYTKYMYIRDSDRVATPNRRQNWCWFVVFVFFFFQKKILALHRYNTQHTHSRCPCSTQRRSRASWIQSPSKWVKFDVYYRQREFLHGREYIYFPLWPQNIVGRYTHDQDVVSCFFL